MNMLIGTEITGSWFSNSDEMLDRLANKSPETEEML